jgi:uncharacterized protein YkwD
MYATDATPGGAATGDTAKLLEHVLLRILHTQRGESPRSDGRLAALAKWASGRGVPGSFDSDQIAVAARRLGHVGPSPSLLMLSGVYSTEAAVDPLVQKYVDDVPTNMPVTRYAIAETSFAGTPVFAIVLASLEVSLDPVPRRFSHEQALHLDGTLASRFERAHLAVTLPGGKVRGFDQPGRAFAIDLRFDAPGIYQVELLGDGKSGPVVVANFPVYVDIAEPAVSRHTNRRAASSAITAASMEEKLLALLDAARAKAHVPPVRSDDDLAAVARGHSRDMAEHGFFGHVSPTLGTTDDRVKRAHLMGLGAYGENIVLARDAEEAHGALMDSPGHRDIMLRPEFTHVGIAAVPEPGTEGQAHFAVTYLFAERLK